MSGTDLVASLAGRVEANPGPQFGILLRACPKPVGIAHPRGAA